MTRSAAILVTLSAGLFFWGCSGSTPTSSTPTTPPTPAKTLVSISVSGPDALQAGQSAQFVATARYSDGSTKVVTSETVWSSSAPPWATVDEKGLVTAVGAGSPQINARYEGMSGSLRITVTPAPATFAGTVQIDSISPATGTTLSYTKNSREPEVIVPITFDNQSSRGTDVWMEACLVDEKTGNIIVFSCNQVKLSSGARGSGLRLRPSIFEWFATRTGTTTSKVVVFLTSIDVYAFNQDTIYRPEADLKMFARAERPWVFFWR